MANKLTASKNPVFVKAGATGVVTISWEMDIGFDEDGGRVDLSINGGAATLFADIPVGALTGSKTQTVRLGETYFFTLRRKPDNALLASLIVTVLDEDGAIFGTSVGDPLEYLINPPQRILGLRVAPSVDTVRVSFTTKHPTIPVVEVETLNGVNVGRVIPLLAGLQTAHETIVGLSEPLPQAARLRLRIIAPGQPRLDGRKGKDVVRTVEFETGARLISVAFDRLQVRADGDDGNKGDFRFGFEASDATEGPTLGVGVYREDIPANDPRDNIWRTLNLSRTIGYVKHEINVVVQGLDDDTHVFSGFGYPALIGETDFPDPAPFTGSRFGTNESADWTIVGATIGIRNLEPGGPAEIPFRLNTGDFRVAFTVEGRVLALMRVGQGYIETLPKSARASAPRIAAIKGPGWGARVTGGKRDSGAKIAIAADGAVWMKYFAPGRNSSAPVDWKQAATAPGGAVTLILDEADKPVLLALDEKGEAVVWRDDGNAGKWVKLGAKLVGAVIAVEGRERRLDLFGVDAERQVLYRPLDPRKPGRADWRRIGGGVSGNLIALPDESGAALFAIDREGQIVHALMRGDEPPSWERIGGPRAEWFGAVTLTKAIGGILVSALTEERVLHVLHWRDFPRGRPHGRWREKGVIDDIIPMSPIERPSAPDGECGERQVDSSDKSDANASRRSAQTASPQSSSRQRKR